MVLVDQITLHLKMMISHSNNDIIDYINLGLMPKFFVNKKFLITKES
jgi:hypothetical protein